MNTQDQPVTASLVAEAQRLDFLPTYFGPRLMMRGEALVYAWLRRLCERYNGAYWHYYTLSDGGFYLAPDLAERLVHLFAELNRMGTTIIIATHELPLLEKFVYPRMVLSDGRVEIDG